MKYLITGFNGFVSKFLLDYLSQIGEPIEIIGLSRSQVEPVHYNHLRIRTYQLDLKNNQLVREIVGSTRPNYIIHLASESSVAYSWQNPLESFQNNTNIFLNIVEAVRASGIKCRILSIGSSEEYGIVNTDTLPLVESHELNPISPYAVARVSQEMLSKIYAKGYGLDVILTRSFNHIGPGQKESFVVSSFAKQIAERKINKILKPIEVGNVSIVRDFLDVRDVVKAYIYLLHKGIKGEVYNICSGIGYKLEEILIKLLRLANEDISYKIKPELVRPSDNPIIIGSNEKIRTLTDWKPEISIDNSLKDILDYWLNRTQSYSND
jgi:GDP-4-dehydro-6-deoxy-D-mannose reductase